MNKTFHRIPGRRTVLALLLAAALAGNVTAAPDDRAMAPSGRDQQTLYWQGHEQLKAGRWDEAIARFAELEDDLRRSEPASADAAMYWRAYALAKARRVGEARAMLDRLRREFPSSRWTGEVERLQKELGGTAAAHDGQDDLVETAIEGLLGAPPERALPLLERVVSGNYAARSKKRALFVLSQMDDPRAAALILQVARSDDRTLRREAITMLAIGGGAESFAALDALYAESRERDVRKAVLGAYLVGGHHDGLLAAARDPADPELRLEAVRLLGAAGAHTALRALYASETDPKVLETVIDAFGISGDAATLAEAVRDSARPKGLRGKALQALGIAGAGAELGALYRELADPELKAAALHGLLIAGDERQLHELYRRAGNDEEKRRILRVLSLTADDSAIDAIEEAISNGERR